MRSMPVTMFPTGRTPHLHLALLVLVEPAEVGRLEELVGEPVNEMPVSLSIRARTDSRATI
jgi:hypothetical protein